MNIWKKCNFVVSLFFLQLAEMIIRQMFVVCKNKSWNIEWVTEFAKVSTQLFLHEKNERFIMYMARIYVEESAKVYTK